MTGTAGWALGLKNWGRAKRVDPIIACSPPGVIFRSSIGTKDTFCEPSPICRPPGDVFGATGPFGGEIVPNLFRSILGLIGVEGVGSMGV